MIMILRCIDVKGIQIPSLRRNLGYGDVFEIGKEIVERNRELQYFIRTGSLDVKEKTSSFPSKINTFPTAPMYQKPLTQQIVAQQATTEIRPINPVNSLTNPPGITVSNQPAPPPAPALDMNALAEMIASKINLQVQASPSMVVSQQMSSSNAMIHPIKQEELVFIPSTIVDKEQKINTPMSSEVSGSDDVSSALKALKKLRKGGG